MTRKPDSHSQSMLKIANKCLREYKLNFIDNIKPERVDSSALQFGTACHTAMQAILEGGNGLEVFSLYWASVKEKPLQYYKFNWEALKNIGEVLLTRFERLHAKNFKIAHPMEVRLYGDINGQKVEGTPDFIGEYKGIPSLVDFKTAKAPYSKHSIEISEQLHLYAYLAKQCLNYEVEQIVYVVLSKNPIRIQVLEKKLAETNHNDIILNIGTQLEELSARIKFPQNLNSCLAGNYKCSYWEYCHGNERRRDSGDTGKGK